MIIGSVSGILINVVLCCRCMFTSTTHVKHSGFPRTRENVSLQALTQANTGITQPFPSPPHEPRANSGQLGFPRKGSWSARQEYSPSCRWKHCLRVCVHVYERSVAVSLVSVRPLLRNGAASAPTIIMVIHKITQISEPDKECHDHSKVAEVKVLWEGLVVDSLLTLWARCPCHSVLSASLENHVAKYNTISIRIPFSLQLPPFLAL